MFGTVQPRPCSLPQDDRDSYKRLYCGTCRGLGEYALAARVLVSYDAVLLSAVIGGVQMSAPGLDSCRCPINPLVHKPIVATDDPAMRVCTAVQMLLADAWLEDHAQDGMPVVGYLRPLLPVDRAVQTLASLGFDAAPLREVNTRQRLVERPGATSAEAVLPTRELIGHVLASAVDLPGTDPLLQTASARAALKRIGAALGSVIYLVDALDDLGRDATTGAFNPCLDTQRRREAKRVEDAVVLLTEAVDTLQEGVSSFPWRRNEHLLQHTIGERLPPRVRKAIEAGRSALAAFPVVPVAREPWSSWFKDRILAFAAEDEGFGEQSPRNRRRKPTDDGQPSESSSCCDSCEPGCDCDCGHCLPSGHCGHCAPCNCDHGGSCCDCGSGCDCGGCDCGGCGGCDCSCG